jgi:hypothetical protein
MTVVFLLVAIFIVAVGLGLQFGRLGAASVTAAALLTILWLLAYYAMSIDWHDADGSSDCWPRCTTLQRSIAAVFFLAPIIGGGLVVVALLTPTVSRVPGNGWDRIALAACLSAVLALVTIAAHGGLGSQTPTFRVHESEDRTIHFYS